MIASAAGGAVQQQQQLNLMSQQQQNQWELNQQALQNGKDIWDYTSFGNQRKNLENAGLNAGLIYGKGGAGGATTNTPGGGSAQGGQAPQNQIVQGMGIGLQAEALQSQIELNKANANKANADAGKAVEDATTVKDSREIMIENMRQNGIAQWFENMKTQALKDGADKDGNVTIFQNEIYGKGEQGYTIDSPEMKKFQAELFKTEAEKMNLDASALLTNNRAKGYWQELLNATENKDSIRINALANKLSSEWNTGEFTNWKTWVDLGMKAVQTAGNLVKGGTTINRSETYNQNGDRWNDTPTN